MGKTPSQMPQVQGGGGSKCKAAPRPWRGGRPEICNSESMVQCVILSSGNSTTVLAEVLIISYSIVVVAENMLTVPRKYCNTADACARSVRHGCTRVSCSSVLDVDIDVRRFRQATPTLLHLRF
jgi:hypothetical protein